MTSEQPIRCQSHDRILECRLVANQTYLLAFDFGETAASILPGQFVDIRITPQTGDLLLRRPFSISRVEGHRTEILFQVVGKGTSLLAQKKTGELLDVLGPLGQSFHTDGDFDIALLVGGGLGIAPMPILAKTLQDVGKQVETFAGFRSASYIVQDHVPNFHCATDDGSAEYHGTVVDLLRQYLASHPAKRYKFFACGPTKMLAALIALAKEKSLCCEVSLEGQMACGVGLCQGCPVERIDGSPKYALVCKEGPVFDATEIRI
jgi:dihydroorotate dehydrogenase electron transfer subunit